MKNVIKIISLVLLSTLLFTACGGVNVYNIKKAPVEVKKSTTLNDVYKAIKRAGYKRGWRVTKVKDGLAKAYIDVRAKHQATVMIKYDLKSYSIEYKSSNNLKYDAENNTIHKNYNSWVRNLDRDIQFELGMIE